MEFPKNPSVSKRSFLFQGVYFQVPCYISGVHVVCKKKYPNFVQLTEIASCAKLAESSENSIEVSKPWEKKLENSDRSPNV